VADALASVGTRLEVVFRYDAASQAWRTYRPGLPALSNLDTLRPGDAVWVGLFPGLQLLWVQPTLAPAPRAVALSPGLNFVTWTGPPLEIEAALGSIAPATDTVFRWDRAARRFDLVYPTLPFAQGPATLQPHDILWLRLRPGPVQTWSQPAP